MSDAPELYARPPRGTLVFSKGGDLVIDFRQRIDGVYTNYASGVTVKLTIDTTPPIEVSAVISGSHAVCKIESEDDDSILPGTVWRCVVSYPTSPRTEIVVMNGTTVRADF